LSRTEPTFPLFRTVRIIFFTQTMSLKPPAYLHRILIAVSTLFAAIPDAHCAAVSWISSTAEQSWQQMPSPTLTAGGPDFVPMIRVTPRKTFQTIDGFGGCFNELGWIALNKASTADRQQALAALFSDDGCAFNLARLPIGASDFATDGYSLAEFSIARDQQHLIPFTKAAMAVRPSLQCWGSPWSPPAWMKTSNSYSKGSLKWEPAILKTYANYFARWIEAYRKQGIAIYAVHPQNEPNILSPYPSCLWTGPQLRDFIADYLGPTLRAKTPDVELWLGTINGDPPNGGYNFNDRIMTVMENEKARSFVTGIAFQYDSRTMISLAKDLYPEKKLMQSETVCNGGANSWEDAQKLYGLMKRFLDNNANSYFAWNMVLDEGGMSTWNWKQNALITVNRQTGKVTYNGEYYTMRHFSQYVKPGAKRVMTTGQWGDKIAFVNPDGSTVIVVGNFSKQKQDVSLTIGGRADGDTLKVSLPAGSINTFVVPAKS
jgi:glucosylceramidase